MPSGAVQHSDFDLLYEAKNHAKAAMDATNPFVAGKRLLTGASCNNLVWARYYQGKIYDIKSVRKQIKGELDMFTLLFFCLHAGLFIRRYWHAE